MRLLLTLSLCLAALAADPRQADIVIYGATSSGVAAAIQASRMGKSVLLLDPGSHIGGLTTGGLSWTDIGNKQVIGGISREFYRRIKAKYERPGAWVHETREHYFSSRRTSNVAAEDAMWTFEPKIASEVYREMLAEHKIKAVLNQRLDLRPGRGVRKRGNAIESILMEGGARYTARMFIDATYEGDLMSKAGVRYTTGRESNSLYGERYNGVQAAHKHGHQFPDGALVSPYIIPGNPASGLLPIINPNGPGVEGEGDKLIQAYCFRMCLSNAPENRIAIGKPAGYEERDHELLLRFAETGKYHPPASKYDPIPNAKTDTNNHGAVSTDYMGANYDYPDGDYQTRARIIKRHEVYQKGYMWTLQNHPRVPESLRNYYRQWGLPKDEFTSNGGWPTQLYIREARRMISPVVMTEQHIIARQVAEDSVGMGAYGMDSHNVQRYVTADGWVRNEGNVQVGGFKPYPISYRSIVPAKEEASNLLVTICLAASHIAYGSIRMEPVFMVLGQSAATAAVQAMDAKVALQDLDYAGLRARLLADKQILTLPR
ncbi:MAG: FAD-dependent oxidoreductase [Acidobacteriia bacterium]|nr:FAD-dependent oxidoreductase [Terriglobia bacterium]